MQRTAGRCGVALINCRDDASRAPLYANLVPNPVWIVRPAIKSITSGVGNQSTHTLPAAAAAAARRRMRMRIRMGWGGILAFWTHRAAAFSQHRQCNSRISNFIARRLQSTAVKEDSTFLRPRVCIAVLLVISLTIIFIHHKHGSSKNNKYNWNISKYTGNKFLQIQTIKS